MKLPTLLKGNHGRSAAIVLFSIMSVVAVTFSVFSLFVRAPDIPTGPSPTPDTAFAAAAKHNPKYLLQASGEDKEDTTGIGEMPDLHTGDRRKGAYTILVFGTSDGYMTDTIMAVSVDTVEKKINLVSIPRDTRVNARRGLKKINGAYGAGGVSQLQSEVASVLGFTTDFYIKVELEGLITLVDAIGGVEFDIPQRMRYHDPTQNLHIDFQKGLQHLDGRAAMELLRFRGYSAGDLRRVEVQQEFLMLVASKLMTSANILKINEFAEVYKQNVETDLTVGNLVWFGMQSYDIGTGNIAMHTLPTYTADPSVNPQYYQFILSKGALQLINEALNPFNEEISMSNVSHPQYETRTS